MRHPRAAATSLHRSRTLLRILHSRTKTSSSPLTRRAAHQRYHIHVDIAQQTPAQMARSDNDADGAAA